MRIFIAGGSGTIGIPLVGALVASGHEVTALTHSSSKRDGLRALGATPTVADALDRQSLIRVEKDAGRHLGYIRAVSRRRVDAVLTDPILSVPTQYTKKPLLREL